MTRKGRHLGKQSHGVQKHKASHHTHAHPIIVLTLLLAVFILPMAGAYYVYHYRSGGLKTKAYGNLVKPVFKIDQLQMRPRVGHEYDFVHIRGHWLLILFYKEYCKGSCLDALEKISKVKTALGNDANRVKFFLVLPDDSKPPLLDVLHSRGPNVEVLVADLDDIYSLFRRLPHEYHVRNGPQLLLVDPFGDVMMHYDGLANGTHVLKDIQHLLKFSASS